MNQYILMADILSSRTKNAKQLIRQFKSIIQECNEVFNKELLSPLTITLGDEFQGVANSLRTGIRIQFFLEEKKIEQSLDFKLRYVLNYGAIDTSINKKIAYEMLGEGLTDARKVLNDLKKDKNTRFVFINTHPNKDGALNDAFLLFTSIVDKWKTADYNLIEKFIRGEDYKDIASDIRKDPSLIWRRRKSLNITEYFAVKRLIKYISE